MRKAALDMGDDEEIRKIQDLTVKDDPGWVLAVTRGENF